MTGVQTTVVGSCPVPAWLRAFPNGEHLRDAMAVVVKAQELAGIEPCRIFTAKVLVTA